MGRCVAFTVELLKRTTDDERVRRFLTNLDRELVLRDSMTVLRRAGAWQHENRVVEVLGRGGRADQWSGGDQWVLLRMRTDSGIETDAFCFDHQPETWVEAPKGDLPRCLPKLLKRSWESPNNLKRLAATITRTIELQGISTSVLEWMPQRGRLLVGMIRLICEPGHGGDCRYCAGRWSEARFAPNCAYCEAVLSRALRGESLPPLGMVVAEASRALDASNEPGRERQLTSLIRWARSASRPGRCPMCQRASDPRVPTARGWICETCLHLPVVAEWRPSSEGGALDGNMEEE